MIDRVLRRVGLQRIPDRADQLRAYQEQREFLDALIDHNTTPWLKKPGT